MLFCCLYQNLKQYIFIIKFAAKVVRNIPQNSYSEVCINIKAFRGRTGLKRTAVCALYKRMEEVLMNTGISNKGWIDIHAHILPGVDDGAYDWDEAMALLRRHMGRESGTS